MLYIVQTNPNLVFLLAIFIDSIGKITSCAINSLHE
jgi:hypothetical protein